MDINQAINSYINGNVSEVKSYVQNSVMGLGHFLEEYINQVNPSTEQIILLVKRLES